MSATTEHTADVPDEHADVHTQDHDHDHDHDNTHIPPDLYFIKVALVLGLLTAMETSTYWIDLGHFHTPVLLILMTIKFFMIVLIFMHLKFDSRIFGMLFYTGLGLAIFVYTVFLFTFKFYQA
jgi:cytochrome c oxidase subunit 4